MHGSVVRPAAAAISRGEVGDHVVRGSSAPSKSKWASLVALGRVVHACMQILPGRGSVAVRSAIDCSESQRHKVCIRRLKKIE